MESMVYSSVRRNNNPNGRSEVMSVVGTSRVKDSILSTSELKGKIEEAIMLDDPKMLHQLNLSRK